MFAELDRQTTDVMLERTALMLCCSFEDVTLPMTLEPEDFSDPAHADIFSAIRTVWAEKHGCNFPDLCLHLTTRPWFEKSGGSAFLARLMTLGPPDTYWPAPEQAVAHALREMRIRRTAREFSVSISRARDMIAQFTRQAEKMAGLLPQQTRTTLEVLDGLEEGPAPWIATGFPSIDRLVNMRKTNLVTVGARTAHGKTVFLCNVACNHARAGNRVSFLTKEMSDDEVVPRFVKYLERKPFEEARKTVDRAILARIVIHKARSIDDVERYASLTDADLVIVDYIQLLETTGRARENRVSELEYITGRLKSIAMDTDKCILTASQVNRETEKLGREPLLADLRGSGSIEQDSNIVILLHNPSAAVSVEHPPSTGGRNVRGDVDRTARSLMGKEDVATFMIAKNRSGPTGRCELRWRQQFCAFDDEKAPLPERDMPF